MKRIQIIKNGIQTHGAEFETQEILDQWLEKHLAKHTFGRPAKFEERENPETGELESIEVEPAEVFDVVITDITSELEQQRINQESLQFLQSTDFKILRHIRQQTLGIKTSLSQEEYTQLELLRHEAASRIV